MCTTERNRNDNDAAGFSQALVFFKSCLKLAFVSAQVPDLPK